MHIDILISITTKTPKKFKKLRGCSIDIG